jgi:hypothetical protein
MISEAKNLDEDIMTPERLRAHWFGKNRVPFWNYDPAQLTLGLEIEYFIAHVDPSTSKFTLATKKQYMEVISHLMRDFGYTDHNLKDQPGRVSKDTKLGFIAIKPDFAWHILEIALPPRHETSEIRDLLVSTFRDVDKALARVGLERLDLSCLPDVPEKMELVELDRLSAHVTLLKEHSDGSQYAIPVFPALIAATHIHANIFNEDTLNNLPSLYESELEALSRFTRKQNFKGIVANNHRSRLYEASLGHQYRLRTVPTRIPSNAREFSVLFNESPKLFPNDSFFPSRDLSYIRPTRHGTFEFRSSCTFKAVDEVMAILNFRRNQILRCMPHNEKNVVGQ